MSSRGKQKKENAIKEIQRAAVDQIKIYSVQNLVESMNFILQELNDRGVAVKDYDNKNKQVKLVNVIGNGVYFLSE